MSGNSEQPRQRPATPYVFRPGFRGWLHRLATEPRDTIYGTTGRALCRAGHHNAACDGQPGHRYPPCTCLLSRIHQRL